MKRNNNLLYTTAALGAVILVLRIWLYAVALDEKNLLVSGHWLSWVIGAAAVVCLALALTAGMGARRSILLPGKGTVAALGDMLFALAAGFTVFTFGTPVSVVEKLRMAAGFLCALGLLVSAVCRWRGKPVFFGCYCAVCLFFAVYLVSCYRGWSSNPQLQDYLFAMLACVSVTLFGYQNAALAVNLGNPGVWKASGLLAVCFGMAAVYRSEAPLLYVAGAVWAVTSLISTRVKTKGE